MDIKNNTGQGNTGYRNTGSHNSGTANVGHRNSGRRNIGDWNSGSDNTGYFNAKQHDCFCVFDKPYGKQEWEEFLQDFVLPLWLFFELEEYNDEDTAMRALAYKQAFKKSYEQASRYEQLRIRNLPNFDAKVFEEISGINIYAEPKNQLEKLEELLKLAENEKWALRETQVLLNQIKKELYK